MEGVFICFVGHTLRYRPTTALPCEGRKKKNRRVVLLCDAAALLLQMGSCFSSCCRGLFLSFGALAQCVGCNESQDHSHNHHDDRDDKVVTGTGGVNVGRQADEARRGDNVLGHAQDTGQQTTDAATDHSANQRVGLGEQHTVDARLGDAAQSGDTGKR